MKLPKRLFRNDPRLEAVTPHPETQVPKRIFEPHPEPYTDGTFAGDHILGEDEPAPVIRHVAEPPVARLGVDPAKHVIQVPVARFIEMETQHCLDGLSALGFRVDRSKGSSAIDLTRCMRATEAVLEGFESIMFIDSDMKFDPADAVKLMRHDAPVIGGVYVPKRLNKEGAGHFNAYFPPNLESIKFGDIARGTVYPVTRIGAGFLRIKTAALREMIERLKLPWCRMQDRHGWPFFQPAVIQERGQHLYLPEDYAFCWRCQQAGIPIVADTSFRLYHIGDYPYGLEEALGQYVVRQANLEITQTIVEAQP